MVSVDLTFVERFFGLHILQPSTDFKVMFLSGLRKNRIDYYICHNLMMFSNMRLSIKTKEEAMFDGECRNFDLIVRIVLLWKHPYDGLRIRTMEATWLEHRMPDWLFVSVAFVLLGSIMWCITFEWSLWVFRTLLFAAELCSMGSVRILDRWNGLRSVF